MRQKEVAHRAHQREAAPSGVGAAEGMVALALSVTRQLARTRAELLTLRAERDDANRRFQAISNSTIWRLSAPVRRLIEWLSKLRGASRPRRPFPDTTPLAAEAAPQPTDLAELKAAFRDQCMRDLDAFLAAGDRLSLPAAVKPRVSILIVLFNQAELTLHCLRSLALEAGSETEVVIVDNNSTDRTGALLDRLDGARVIRAPENLHFLRGVNRAAEDACGTYLLLLNNDTRVEPGAIRAAAARLDAEPDLGAVGGPIVMLDGTLQEAGCIIWNNGHTQGYGRGRDAADWEFQFRRDVDYCSGAFLMIRRDLFERLGGLDTSYAPAYFEETDLCMRIREVGFRVGYEPAARIVHYEYGSATSSGEAIKLYMHNRERFVARHATALAAGHHAPTASVLRARMRGGSAGRVLIVDSCVWGPCAAACRPMSRWLARTMLDAGFAVTYCAPGEAQGDPAGTDPAMPENIECAVAPDRDAVPALLRQRSGHYDAVVLLGPKHGGLPAGTKEALEGALEGAVLIDLSCRQDDAAGQDPVARETRQDSMTTEPPCAICGGTTFHDRMVIWDELADAWALSSDERRMVDRQQGTCCDGCGGNLRSIALAAAIVAAAGAKGTLAAFVDSPAAAHLQVLEINEAGTLSPVLSRMPGHRFRAYPDLDIQAMNFADGTFDLVIHSDTLEHVLDPARALAECRRVLRSSGVLCFTVPVLPGRLSRNVSAGPVMYHGNPADPREDYRVHTDFGADVWNAVLAAGFAAVTLSRFDDGLAITAFPELPRRR